MSRRSYSEQDIRIIEKLIKAGYGWKAFALNVQKQGWITDIQSDTLCHMSNNLSAQYIKATSPKYGTASNKRGYGDEDNFEGFDYGGQGECF